MSATDSFASAVNDADDRLYAAVDATAGLSAEALQTIYGRAGSDLGLSGRRPAVLDNDPPIEALERVDTTRVRKWHMITRGEDYAFARPPLTATPGGPLPSRALTVS